MSIQRLLAAGAAVSLLTLSSLGGVVHAQTPAAAPAAKLAANGDTMTTLRTSPQFTTLVKALDAANLSALFQDRTRSMTLFAPTDAAFAALPAGQLDKMIADPTKADLRKLLTHHVINAPVLSAKLKGTRGPWPSGAGDHIVLDGSQEGVLKADNANIIQADVTTSNGAIQVVDQVMIAGSVPEALPQPAAEAPPAAEPTPAPPPPKAPAKRKK